MPTVLVPTRNRELGAILKLAEQSREATLLIRGERGSGKSTLLAGAHSLLQPPAVLVRATRSEAACSLSGLSAVCSAIGAPEIGTFFEELRRAAIGSVDPFAVAVEFAALLRSLEIARMVVLVDDVDEFDDVSRAIIAFLSRRLTGTGIRFAMSLSSDVHDDQFAGLDVIVLDRLSRDQSIAFVRARTDLAPAVLELVCHDAGGRPDALVDQLAELDHSQAMGDSPLVLPLHGSERVGARLATMASRLDGDKTRLLDSLASAPVTPVTALTDGTSGARDDLDDLEVSGFVVIDARFVRISDPQLRSRLYWRRDAKARRQRHEELADLLADVDHRLRAWHVSFVNSDAVRAIDMLRAARSLAETDEPGAAVEFAERALSVRREGERLGEILADLSEALLHRGSVGFATRYVRMAGRERLDTSLTLRLAELRLQLDFADNEATVPGSETTVARRHAEKAPTAAAAYLELAASLHAERWEVDSSRHALAEAQNLGDQRDESGLRHVSVLIGDAVEGRPRRVLDRYREATRDGLVGIPPAQLALFGNALSLGERYDEARAVFASVLRIEDETTPLWETAARLYLVDNEIRAGNHARAAQAVEELESRDLSVQLFPAHRLVQLVWYFHSVGDADRAVPYLEQSERADFVDRSPAMLARLRAHLGEFALLRGDTDEALRQLSQLDLVAERFGNPALLRYEADLIEALSRGGRLADAIAAYRALQERASRHPSRWSTLALARSKGFVTTGEASVATFRQALRFCSSEDSRYERARSLLGLAYRLRQSGQPRESHESYLAAAALFTTFGARAWARAARDMASGVHHTGPAADGENGMLRLLTSDERAVVDRVLLGQRNREIAEELFVSVRTVEIRLTRTYRKLGVRSRAHLASACARSFSRNEPGAS